MSTLAYRAGMTVLALVALTQIGAAAYQLFGDVEGIFYADTRVTWTQFSSTYPAVAEQFSILHRQALIAALLIGLFGLLASTVGLAGHHRWAWWGLWLMPAYMVPGVISLVDTVGLDPISIFPIVLLAAAVLGLGPTARTPAAGSQR